MGCTKAQMDSVTNAFKTKLVSESDHSDTLVSISNLALTYILYLKLERWNEAQSLQSADGGDERKVKKMKVGSDHLPDATLISIINHPPSNQVLQMVQQDHNKPENMVN